MTAVCAVLPPTGAGLDAAVRAQTAAVDVLVRDEDVLRSGLRRALAEDVEWIWLLDGSAMPAPGALERLLATLTTPVPITPVLLVSKVTNSGGALAVGQAPWPRRGATELAMAVAPHKLLPVRAARAGSALVDRAAAARIPAAADGLEPSAAALEWTARLLRTDIGLLVTGSVCLAQTGGAGEAEVLSARPEDDLRAGVAMLSGAGWYAKEKLWLGAEVAERAARTLRARRAGPLGLTRAAVGGWRARR